MTAGRVLAVSVVHAVKDDVGSPTGTAIDKRPVDGRRQVAPYGVAGDFVMDGKYHGGLHKAVYVYASEDQAHWAAELGLVIPPGRFGENLTTADVSVSDAVIGERWQVGDDGLVLEVSEPRIPCMTFQRHMGQPRWIRRFTEYGACGAYCRVVVPGTVGAGDTVTVLSRPAHGVSVRDTFKPREADPARLRKLLAGRGVSPDLAKDLRRRMGAAAS